MGGLWRLTPSPELGDSRAKQPKRSIKEVFKKRSVWLFTVWVQTKEVGRKNFCKFAKYRKKWKRWETPAGQADVSANLKRTFLFKALLTLLIVIAEELCWRSDLSHLDKEEALCDLILWINLELNKDWETKGEVQYWICRSEPLLCLTFVPLLDRHLASDACFKQRGLRSEK